MEASRATAVASPAAAALRQALRDYVALTKPRVQSLLLFTTACAMFIAGSPSLALVLATLVGGAMSAGGSGAINHWYDRDIDARMERTADRPVAAGRISPRAALAFGIGLGVVSVAWLALLVNPLAAALSLAGFLGYAVGYTVFLKRSTWQNIVWGGAAGAVPPLVGWAAVTIQRTMTARSRTAPRMVRNQRPTSPIRTIVRATATRTGWTLGPGR